MLNKNYTIQAKLLTFFIAFISCLGMVFLFDMSVKFFGYPYTLYMDDTVETPQHAIFYSIVFAPLWEELAYRYGPIEIAKKLGKETLLPIMVMSSCIFGWGHYNNPESVLLQGSIGFILSVVYVRNGLLWSMALHSLYNITMSF